MGWFILWSTMTAAQQSISLDVIHSVHAPKKPELVLTVHVPAHRIAVNLTCGQTTTEFSDAAHQGETIRIPINVPPGQHPCTGSLDAQFTDDTTGSMPLAFTVAVQAPIQLTVSATDLVLDRGRLQVHINRPIAQLDVDIFDDKGQRVAAASRGPAATSPVTIEWAPTAASVTRVKITATGPSGLSTALDLFPWRYAIPHEDVVFPSGSALIPPSEIHKLRAAQQEIDATLARFDGAVLGFEIPMRLYVAGFTDTVGNRVTNQALSEARARAIARWFESNGFQRPILIQGFGERGLAVPTPDETDAPANRRAEYIIAAESPNTASLPSGAWLRLR